jgi:hypothetical protein
MKFFTTRNVCTNKPKIAIDELNSKIVDISYIHNNLVNFSSKGGLICVRDEYRFE